MVYKRLLRLGSRGGDVRYCKDKLFLLGYYADSVRVIKKDSFGNDTLSAVLRFQRANRDVDGVKLRVDGVIGRKTWGALMALSTPLDEDMLPKTISPLIRAAIHSDLTRVGETRRKLVIEALSYAYDPLVEADYPYSLYIRGANLYTSERSKVVITRSTIESGAKRQPQYYSGGRKEMMLAALARNPRITGADCSGGVVGLLRAYGLSKASFDATADTLTGTRHSSSIKKADLQAGDWVGRSGHIGVYAGGGYVVEWMGGAYGCQLTKLDARRGYNFVTKKTDAKSAWTRFRRPDAY